MAKLTAEQVVAGLVARGVPEHIAQGVAMNFRDESGFDTSIVNPTGGDFGIAQWTGGRLANLKSFAASQNKPVDDPDVQLDFFMSENAGPEKAAWDKVLAAPDSRQAAVSFVNNWERPAPEHAAARSNKYLNLTPETATASGGARHPQNPQVGTGGYIASGAPVIPVPAPPPVATVAATEPAENPVQLVDKSNPWASLGSGMASSVVGSGGGSGVAAGGFGGSNGPAGVPEFASAQPALPAPTPAADPVSELAELFKVDPASFGQPLAATDRFGNPVRAREYG
jgi:hypothetical protein